MRFGSGEIPAARKRRNCTARPASLAARQLALFGIHLEQIRDVSHVFVAKCKLCSRRATDAQVLEDAECLIAARAPSQANAHAILADDRRRRRCGILVPVGSLPSLPHYERDRLAHARPSPRRGCDQPHSRIVLSLMPAQRAVRRARATVPDQHRRRNAGRAPAKSSRRRTIGVPRL
jgi:hypothetical protein